MTSWPCLSCLLFSSRPSDCLPGSRPPLARVTPSPLMCPSCPWSVSQPLSEEAFQSLLRLRDVSWLPFWPPSMRAVVLAWLDPPPTPVVREMRDCGRRDVMKSMQRTSVCPSAVSETDVSDFFPFLVTALAASVDLTAAPPEPARISSSI